MEKIELNATFIIFARIDNEKRFDNLTAIVTFYRDHVADAKFIIVEDDNRPLLLTEYCSFEDYIHDDTTYVYQYNSKEWNKSRGYNTGIKLAQTERLIFNDVDAVIKPSQLKVSFELLEKTLKDNQLTDGGIIYPYNGEFLCVDNDIKQIFCDTLDYNKLDQLYPEQLLTTHNKHALINQVINGVLIGHVQSKGGCVLSHRNTMIKHGGYNPQFEGWGYEDDEMPTRLHKLGAFVTRLDAEKAPCWHLDHTDESSSQKEHQPNYEKNRQIAEFVDNANMYELQDFIKSWKL